MYIYILELQNNKYYIGITENPRFTLSDYKNLNGYKWTYENIPLKLNKLIPYCNKYDLDKYVLINMQKYGINNVRGGSFSEYSFDYNTTQFIRNMICNTNNLCNNCGNPNHNTKCNYNNYIFIKEPIVFTYYDKNDISNEGILYFNKNEYNKIRSIHQALVYNDTPSTKIPIFNIKIRSDKILQKHPQIIEILEDIKKDCGYYIHSEDIFRSDCNIRNYEYSLANMNYNKYKFKQFLVKAIYYDSMIQYYDFIKKNHNIKIDDIKLQNTKYQIKQYGQSIYFIIIESNYIPRELH